VVRMMLALQDAILIARMLASLSEPTRLQITLRLLQRPHYVGELSELLRLPMVNVSHHLGVLRQAGLVEDIKKGRRVEYRLREEIWPGSTADHSQMILHLGPYRLWITDPPPLESLAPPVPRRRGRPRCRPR
jgi:DNA-binding transcriptional ArsR family regulator